MSGDFSGSQEGCQGPSRPSGRNRGLPLRRRRGHPCQGWDLEVMRMRCPGQNYRPHLLSGCFRCRTSPESEHFLNVCPLAASTASLWSWPCPHSVPGFLARGIYRLRLNLTLHCPGRYLLRFSHLAAYKLGVGNLGDAAQGS